MGCTPQPKAREQQQIRQSSTRSVYGVVLNFWKTTAAMRSLPILKRGRKPSTRQTEPITQQWWIDNKSTDTAFRILCQLNFFLNHNFYILWLRMLVLGWYTCPDCVSVRRQLWLSAWAYLITQSLGASWATSPFRDRCPWLIYIQQLIKCPRRGAYGRMGDAVPAHLYIWMPQMPYQQENVTKVPRNTHYPVWATARLQTERALLYIYIHLRW